MPISIIFSKHICDIWNALPNFVFEVLRLQIIFRRLLDEVDQSQFTVLLCWARISGYTPFVLWSVLRSYSLNFVACLLADVLRWSSDKERDIVDRSRCRTWLHDRLPQHWSTCHTRRQTSNRETTHDAWSTQHHRRLTRPGTCLDSVHWPWNLLVVQSLW